MGKLMNYSKPLRLLPCYKDFIWGGTRLKKEYGKFGAPDKIAESWELAAHADGNSIIAEGPLEGKAISELAKVNRTDFWGTACGLEEFPILVKLIDASKSLSVQVHPSDATANVSAGEKGKAELWYVVDCDSSAYIYIGFSKRITKKEFLLRAKEGTICEVLNYVPIKKGDIFYILPGTVHAIGAGSIIAEIQQNSNTTFRIYDYQRCDKNGNLRPLNIRRASEVISYEPLVPSTCRSNAKAKFGGFSLTEMFSCEYFAAYRLDVENEASLYCDGTSFQHLLCVDGSGKLVKDEKEYPIAKGQSFFLPAVMGEYRLCGKCRILLSRVWEGKK